MILNMWMCMDALPPLLDGPTWSLRQPTISQWAFPDLWCFLLFIFKCLFLLVIFSFRDFSKWKAPHHQEDYIKAQLAFAGKEENARKRWFCLSVPIKCQGLSTLRNSRYQVPLHSVHMKKWQEWCALVHMQLNRFSGISKASHPCLLYLHRLLFYPIPHPLASFVSRFKYQNGTRERCAMCQLLPFIMLILMQPTSQICNAILHCSFYNQWQLPPPF